MVRIVGFPSRYLTAWHSRRGLRFSSGLRGSAPCPWTLLECSVGPEA